MLYEYECSSCKYLWEELQKLNDPPIDKCPKCGESTVTKLISLSSFVLKGGGWSSDNYSSKKQ